MSRLTQKQLAELPKLPVCSHSVVVSTADFESAILGSSPGESLNVFTQQH